jgi:branched-chain amino acid transport system ATP-binding protein
MSRLEVRSLVVARGGLPVCRGISLEAPPGEVTVLLGANGAGKTTLLEAISGVLPVAEGDVLVGERSIVRLTRDKRARLGVSHVEQGRTVFGRLTVEENLRLPAGRAPVAGALTAFPALGRRRSTLAMHLSGGEQQMLVIARALCADPQVLLLDELSLGLAPVIVRGLMSDIRSLADRGLSILLVEQFAALALQIGTRAYVMTHGEVAYDGTCEDLVREPERLRRAYLGLA